MELGDLRRLPRRAVLRAHDRLRRLDLPSPGKAERVVRDHHAIVAALAARDPDAAQAAMRTHLSGTLGRIADIRVRHPDYVAG